MLVAIQVKGLSLAQEARIIRRLEKSKRQSAKWAKEKQKAIEMAHAGNFPHYEEKPITKMAKVTAITGRKCIAKYQARIAAKNRLTDIARKMAVVVAHPGAPGIAADVTKYYIGAIEATIDAQSLYVHRIHVVRPEARCAHLALGFLRGKPYVAMENKSYDWPNWNWI